MGSSTFQEWGESWFWSCDLSGSDSGAITGRQGGRAGDGGQPSLPLWSVHPQATEALAHKDL